VLSASDCARILAFRVHDSAHRQRVFLAAAGLVLLRLCGTDLLLSGRIVTRGGGIPGKKLAQLAPPEISAIGRILRQATALDLRSGRLFP
jgi:hypothetical protein